MSFSFISLIKVNYVFSLWTKKLSIYEKYLDIVGKNNIYFSIDTFVSVYLYDYSGSSMLNMN